MTDQSPASEYLDVPLAEPFESPAHGYRGETSRFPGIPQGLTIAISREAGARGVAIARRAGEKLNWQVYSQDLLEFLSQDDSFCEQMLQQLPPEGNDWLASEMDRLMKQQCVSRHPSIVSLSRTVLALGGQGSTVLLGRGAGFILPRHSTLHVRLAAPLEDRVAYLAQWLRLPESEAFEQVRKRDLRRAEFIFTHFHRKPSDVHAFDLLLNSSLLGEELCCDLIVQAAQAKLRMMQAG